MKQAKKFPFLSVVRKRLLLTVDNRSFATVPDETAFFRWVWQTIKPVYRYAEIGIVLLPSDQARGYNRQYRGKDYATNVLSFPYETDFRHGEAVLKGDLVLCPDVVADEAFDQGVEISAHYAHLTVHGVLHVMGFDHETHEDALQMESLEISVLNQLGYENPYIEED